MRGCSPRGVGGCGLPWVPPSSGPPSRPRLWVPVPARTPEPRAQRHPLVFARRLAGQRESTPSSLPTLQPPPGPWFRVLALRPHRCPTGLPVDGGWGAFVRTQARSRAERAGLSQTRPQLSMGQPCPGPGLCSLEAAETPQSKRQGSCWREPPQLMPGPLCPTWEPPATRAGGLLGRLMGWGSEGQCVCVCARVCTCVSIRLCTRVCAHVKYGAVCVHLASSLRADTLPRPLQLPSPSPSPS